MSTVTREEVEAEMLQYTVEAHGIISIHPEEFMNNLFHPPFNPKKGEVIAAWNENQDSAEYGKFNKTDGIDYMLENGYLFAHARPLTAQEKGE